MNFLAHIIIALIGEHKRATILIILSLSFMHDIYATDSSAFYENQYQRALAQKQWDSAYYAYVNYQTALLKILKEEQTNTPDILEKKEQIIKEENITDRIQQTIFTYADRKNRLDGFMLVALGVVVLLTLILVYYFLQKKKIKAIQHLNADIQFKQKETVQKKKKVNEAFDISLAIANDIQFSTMPLVNSIINQCNILHAHYEDATLAVIEDIAWQSKVDLNHLHLYIHQPELFDWSITQQLHFITAQLLPQEKITLNIENELPDAFHLEDDQLLHVNRIILEFIQNTIKHSKASEIKLILQSTSNLFTIQYLDNGIGYRKNHKSDGIGHINLLQRISQLQGTLEFPEVAQGFLAIISLPITLPEKIQSAG